MKTYLIRTTYFSDRNSDQKTTVIGHRFCRQSSTRGELDEIEQRNIEEAIRWTTERRRKFTVAEILTEDFVRELHQKMLGAVWEWAGTFRKSDKNMGVDKYQPNYWIRAARIDNNITDN